MIERGGLDAFVWLISCPVTDVSCFEGIPPFGDIDE